MEYHSLPPVSPITKEFKECIEAMEDYVESVNPIAEYSTNQQNTYEKHYQRIS